LRKRQSGDVARHSRRHHRRRRRQLALAHEWYRPVDAWMGPQSALLAVLALTGLDGVTKPALAV
jgi:hypothetical protein